MYEYTETERDTAKKKELRILFIILYQSMIVGLAIYAFHSFRLFDEIWKEVTAYVFAAVAIQCILYMVFSRLFESDREEAMILLRTKREKKKHQMKMVSESQLAMMEHQLDFMNEMLRQHSEAKKKAVKVYLEEELL